MSYREPFREDPLKFVVEEEAIHEEGLHRQNEAQQLKRDAWPEALSALDINSWEEIQTNLLARGAVLTAGGVLYLALMMILSLAVLLFAYIPGVVIAFLLLFEVTTGNGLKAIFNAVGPVITWYLDHHALRVAFFAVVTALLLRSRWWKVAKETWTVIRYSRTARRLGCRGDTAAKTVSLDVLKRAVFQKGLHSLFDMLYERIGQPRGLRSLRGIDVEGEIHDFKIAVSSTIAIASLDRVGYLLETLEKALLNLERRRTSAWSNKPDSPMERDRERLNEQDRAIIRRTFEELLVLLAPPPLAAPKTQIRVDVETLITTDHEAARHAPLETHGPQATWATAGNDT